MATATGSGDVDTASSTNNPDRNDDRRNRVNKQHFELFVIEGEGIETFVLLIRWSKCLLLFAEYLLNLMVYLCIYR